MGPLLKYRAMLIFDSLSLIAFGIAFLVDPHGMTSQFGITLSGTDAVADVCAVYGGYELGIGVFLAYCAISQKSIKFGLIAGAMALTGFFLGRVTGIVIDGHPASPTYKLLFIDTLGMVLNLTSLYFYMRLIKLKPELA